LFQCPENVRKAHPSQQNYFISVPQTDFLIDGPFRALGKWAMTSMIILSSSSSSMDRLEHFARSNGGPNRSNLFLLTSCYMLTDEWPGLTSIIIFGLFLLYLSELNAKRNLYIQPAHLFWRLSLQNQIL
jgi:hypothetical protein